MGGNFQIFVDAECTDGGSDGGGSSSADQMEAPTSFETGTVTQNAKENTTEPTPWNGVTMQQKHERAVADCPFPIFDEEIPCAEEGAASNALGGAAEEAPRRNVRLQLDGPAMLRSQHLEALESAPLGRFESADAAAPSRQVTRPEDAENAPAAIAQQQQPEQRVTAAAPPPAGAPPLAVAAKSELKVSFDRALLTRDGEECQFEEARAYRHPAFKRAAPDPPPEETAEAEEEIDDGGDAMDMASDDDDAMDMTCSFGGVIAVAPVSETSVDPQGPPTAPPAAAPPAAAPPAAAPPSQEAPLLAEASADLTMNTMYGDVTVNTKAALRELMPSFHAEVHDEQEDEVLACGRAEPPLAAAAPTGASFQIFQDEAGDENAPPRPRALPSEPAVEPVVDGVAVEGTPRAAAFSIFGDETSEAAPVLGTPRGLGSLGARDESDTMSARREQGYTMLQTDTPRAMPFAADQPAAAARCALLACDTPRPAAASGFGARKPLGASRLHETPQPPPTATRGDLLGSASRAALLGSAAGAGTSSCVRRIGLGGASTPLHEEHRQPPLLHDRPPLLFEEEEEQTLGVGDVTVNTKAALQALMPSFTTECWEGEGGDEQDEEPLIAVAPPPVAPASFAPHAPVAPFGLSAAASAEARYSSTPFRACGDAPRAPPPRQILEEPFVVFDDSET